MTSILKANKMAIQVSPNWVWQINKTGVGKGQRGKRGLCREEGDPTRPWVLCISPQLTLRTPSLYFHPLHLVSSPCSSSIVVLILLISLMRTGVCVCMCTRVCLCTCTRVHACVGMGVCWPEKKPLVTQDQRESQEPPGKMYLICS